jgi:outer membrane biosynthesis protein TonB
MASTERIFFAGVATTVLLIGAGFSGGVMLGKTAMAPVPEAKLAQARIESKSELPPARVVLPAASETLQHAPAPSPQTPARVVVPEPQPQQPAVEPDPQGTPAKDVKTQDDEKDKQAKAEAETQKAERADRRKQEAKRERRQHRVAERKARQDAVREQRQQELPQQAVEQQQEQEARRRARPFGIVAFDGSDDPASDVEYDGE